MNPLLDETTQDLSATQPSTVQPQVPRLVRRRLPMQRATSEEKNGEGKKKCPKCGSWGKNADAPTRPYHYPPKPCTRDWKFCVDGQNLSKFIKAIQTLGIVNIDKDKMSPLHQSMMVTHHITEPESDKTLFAVLVRFNIPITNDVLISKMVTQACLEYEAMSGKDEDWLKADFELNMLSRDRQCP